MLQGVAEFCHFYPPPKNDASCKIWQDFASPYFQYRKDKSETIPNKLLNIKKCEGAKCSSKWQDCGVFSNRKIYLYRNMSYRK